MTADTATRSSAAAPAKLVPEDIALSVISPTAYAEDKPVHDAFRWLRANNPLGLAKVEGLYPFWIVTKHADILEISRQNDLFHSGDMPTTFTTIKGDEIVRKMTGGSPHLLRTLVQMDAPGSPQIPGADPVLVPAAEHPPAGGSHPRDRPRPRRSHGQPRRRVRLRARCGAHLSAAGDHGDPGRAARGRAAHAEADPGAVRRRRPRAQPFQGRTRIGRGGRQFWRPAGGDRRLLHVLQRHHRRPQGRADGGSGQRDRQRPDRRRADQRLRGHELLRDRRHRRPRHHLIVHRRGHLGHVPVPRAPSPR